MFYGVTRFDETEAAHVWELAGLFGDVPAAPGAPVAVTSSTPETVIVPNKTPLKKKGKQPLEFTVPKPAPINRTWIIGAVTLGTVMAGFLVYKIISRR